MTETKATSTRPVWKTKFGPRRVKHDPPTLDEAIFAAKGLTDDPQQQVEIVAGLMDLSVEEVRVAVLKASQRKDVNQVMFTRRAGTERAVVVERKPVRRLSSRLPPRR